MSDCGYARAQQEIETVKGDVLKALVALEMAEDRLNEVTE